MTVNSVYSSDFSGKSKENKKMFILDGYGILFRAFYAIPTLNTKTGIPIGAIYGACRVIINLINKHSDADWVVCLDGSDGSFRKELYPSYKANRVCPPDELLPQFDIFDELIDAIGIPRERVNGYEADDIIATYVRIASDSKNVQPVIVSSDKDLMQLIYGNVLYYNLQIKKYIDHDYVVKKFGVQPNQLLDYLALIGDKSDNVPGVKFVGAKMAVNVINKFGSIDNIYDRLDEIDNVRLKGLLLNGKEDAFLSKKLVTLCNDIDRRHSLSSPKKCLESTDDIYKFAQKYDIDFIKLGTLNTTSATKARLTKSVNIPNKSSNLKLNVSSVGLQTVKRNSVKPQGDLFCRSTPPKQD
ncbi:MAG: hypothetical protein JJW01_03225 [Alphaproteobacteria bacterium]|nr:hypothetical protein [Rickettsiales bacterium]